MTEYAGEIGNWIAPFHACRRCGKSLNWQEGEDALERPCISAICADCAVEYCVALRPVPPDKRNRKRVRQGHLGGWS